MKLNPNCPNCDADEIEVDDMYDMEKEPETVICSYIGTCKKCHHTIQWESHFIFSTNINITDYGLDKDYDFYCKIKS